MTVFKTMWHTVHAASTLYTQGSSGSIDYVCQGTLFSKLVLYPYICIQKQTAIEIAMKSVDLVHEWRAMHAARLCLVTFAACLTQQPVCNLLQRAHGKQA